jgi:hypothetical protein
MGRAPSGPARLSPARAKQAGNGHGPVVFPGPAQRQLKKSLFHFLFIILDEKHFGKCFLGHFSSKNGEINFYVLI